MRIGPAFAKPCDVSRGWGSGIGPKRFTRQCYTSGPLFSELRGGVLLDRFPVTETRSVGSIERGKYADFVAVLLPTRDDAPNALHLQELRPLYNQRRGIRRQRQPGATVDQVITERPVRTRQLSGDDPVEELRAEQPHINGGLRL